MLPAILVLVIALAAALVIRSISHSGAVSPKGHGVARVPPRHAVTRGHSRPGASHATPRPLGVGGDWKLVLNSEFTGRRLNTRLWRPGWFGTGVTSPINAHEVACYSPRNVTFPGDRTVHLAVTARRSYCGGRIHPYTGAVLSTNPRDGRRHGGFAYRYGLLQAKVFVPGAAAKVADWPAVITLGQVWPRDGEDDIMENLEGTVCSHFHSPGFAPGGPLGGCDPTFTPGWHIVSAVWEPGAVTWYYDGIEIGHITEGVTSAPMYIVLVNTVSVKSPGVSKADALRVAYVRVWQKPSSSR